MKLNKIKLLFVLIFNIGTILNTENRLFSQTQDTFYKTNFYPGSTGWISKYISLVDKGKIKLELTNKESFIPIFERPDSLIFANKILDSNWTTLEKKKILFFECMFNCFLKNKKIKDIFLFFDSLSDFYELKHDSVNTYKHLEKEINNRLINNIKSIKDIKYYHDLNPYIYIDLLLFNEYLNSGLTINEFPFIELKILMLKECEKITKIDNSISISEQRFLNLLYCNLNRAKYSPSTSNLSFDYAIDIFNSEFSLTLFKTFYFQLLLIDGISNVETNWFKSMYGKIDVNNKEKTDFSLTNTNNFLNQFSFNWKIIKRRNYQKLSQENSETKKWGKLLFKKGKLTDDEKKFRKNQTKDVLMVLPSTVIFIIPGGSIILPFVVKFVPAFLPSSFRDNSIKE